MLVIRSVLTIAFASLLLTAPFAPAPASAAPAGAAPTAPTGFKVPVSARDVQGNFWVAAPLYACPMDPEVHSEAPGTCPKCHMDLERTATRVRLDVKTLGGQSFAGRTARLGVSGKPGALRSVTFNKDGVAEGSFMMPVGAYTLTAEVVTPGNGHRVKLTAPYQVR
jgi:hypothetical protein